jgi:hypothetical protein
MKLIHFSIKFGKSKQLNRVQLLKIKGTSLNLLQPNASIDEAFFMSAYSETWALSSVG